jgi:hypothetical protein
MTGPMTASLSTLKIKKGRPVSHPFLLVLAPWYAVLYVPDEATHPNRALWMIHEHSTRSLQNVHLGVPGQAATKFFGHLEQRTLRTTTVTLSEISSPAEATDGSAFHARFPASFLMG